MNASFNNDKKSLKIVSHTDKDTLIAMPNKNERPAISLVLSNNAKEFNKIMVYVNPWISLRNPFHEKKGLKKVKKFFRKHTKKK